MLVTWERYTCNRVLWTLNWTVKIHGKSLKNHLSYNISLVPMFAARSGDLFLRSLLGLPRKVQIAGYLRVWTSLCFGGQHSLWWTIALSEFQPSKKDLTCCYGHDVFSMINDLIWITGPPKIHCSLWWVLSKTTLYSHYPIQSKFTFLCVAYSIVWWTFYSLFCGV